MQETTIKLTCRLCGVEGTPELFVKDKKMKSGYRQKCKQCHNNKNTEWRTLNPEKNKQCWLNWKEKNKMN